MVCFDVARTQVAGGLSSVGLEVAARTGEARLQASLRHVALLTHN